MSEDLHYDHLLHDAQTLARDLHTVSGLHVGIHDPHRTHTVSAGDNISNLCAVCSKMCAAFGKQCHCDDRTFLAQAEHKQKPIVYQCHLGLTEVILPIVEEDMTAGVIFLGQVRIPSPQTTFDAIMERLRTLDAESFSESRRPMLLAAYENTCCLSQEKLDGFIALATLAAKGIYVNRWLKFNAVTTEQHFRHYVSEHLDLVHLPLSAFSVERVAHDLNISYSQLNRISTAVFGMPLKQYVLQNKIDASCHLLRKYPTQTVREIAAMVGIENPHYFSRLFSERMGCSCTEYRERV